jgi:chromosomal replication initiation ATPase DnaA
MKEFTMRYFNLYWSKFYKGLTLVQMMEILRLMEVDLTNRIIKKNQDKKMTLEVLEIRLRRQGVNLIKTRTKKRSISEDRMIYMHLADKNNIASQETIANYCGLKAHDNVCYANRTIKNLLFSSKTFKAKYDSIKI